MIPAPLEWSEGAEDLVQETRDRAKETATATRIVEQAGNGAEQVAEEVARAGLRGDVEVYRAQVDDQTEEV